MFGILTILAQRPSGPRQVITITTNKAAGSTQAAFEALLDEAIALVPFATARAEVGVLFFGVWPGGVD